MKRISIVLAAVALILGLSQCKKQEQSSINEENIVPITLDVRTNGGSRIDVNTANGAVSFETGDVVYVASGNKFVGTLTYNGATFAGNLTNPTTGEPLYFYFLGNKTPEETLNAGTSTYCSVSISDQTSGKLPVISSATSNETFTGAGLYTAFFFNKAALVKFNVSTQTLVATDILGMNNKVTVDFATNGFAYSQDGEGIITLPSGSGERWAILLPQAEVTDAVAQSHGVSSIGTCGTIPAIASNDYLTAGIVVTITASYDDHPYVDLGLPSGLLWAACNVGADNPTSSGIRLAWGETQPKSTYNWNNYQYCHGNEQTMTKYCNNSNYGYNGFADNLTTLLPEDDAATANWGSDWRMPTHDEWEELLNNTTRTPTGNGLLFTASNGNSLLLPYKNWTESMYDEWANGCYWSSSLSIIYPNSAWVFKFGDNPDYYDIGTRNTISRSSGRSIRAVRCKNSVINVTSNPTEGGEVSGGGTYMDHTSCTITATANEDYVFTCWTDKGVVVSTEATYTFMVSGNRDLVANFIRANSYVDLGLPSGTLWATCNVGADSPEEYGDYFAWGETSPKDIYNWSTYQYCMGTDHTLTKYCDNPDYGYHGFIDELPLLPEDDVATASWGIDWCMPTPDQWWELYNYTTVTWVTQNGVHGRCFTASNGNSLFLPAAGYRFDGSLSYAGNRGRYWSNCYSDIWVPSNAIGFRFGSATYGMDEYERSSGFSVRAVRSSLQN